MKSFKDMLAELTSKPHEIKVVAKAVEPTPAQVDAIHRALLKKQRQSGSLGLNQ